MRMTGGLLALEWARRPPKSVSAEIRACPPVWARSSTAFVGCRLHAEGAYVDGVMPGRLERVGQQRGELSMRNFTR
jgi:hypothetical protein